MIHQFYSQNATLAQLRQITHRDLFLAFMSPDLSQVMDYQYSNLFNKTLKLLHYKYALKASMLK